MYADDELLPISALQHLLYCERQAALIHVERLWAENGLTVEGRHLHAKADRGRASHRKAKETGRSVQLRSLTLGVWGKADVVELTPTTDGSPAVPVPVEYKRGRPKSHDADRVQLCAQALCLEEMLGVAVPAGAIFYGKTRRREAVAFDEGLRSTTRDAIGRLRTMVAGGVTPPAVYERRKCDRCSLVWLCMPKDVGGPSRRATAYLGRALAESLGRDAADPPGHAEGEAP